MHTLHIVSKSPGHPRFLECLFLVDTKDAILLTGNGVVALADSSIQVPAPLYALHDDIQARALTPDSAQCRVIGYDDMVALTIQAQRVISW